MQNWTVDFPAIPKRFRRVPYYVLDGIEATRAIHAECPAVCLIALSMHEMYTQVKAMRDAGGMEYISRSAALDQLLDAIRACYAWRREELPPQAS